MKEYIKMKEPNIQCLDRANFILKANDVGALDSLFYVFPESAEKCWQYTIDFLRGWSCGICDITSTYYYTSEGFTLDPSECSKFASACSEHMQAFKTFYIYAQ